MSERQADKRKYARYALGAWLAGLAGLAAVLIAALTGAPIEPGGGLNAQAPGASRGVFDPGYIMENLPRPGSVKVPAPAFAAENEYVLLGFGLQGFYLTCTEGGPWQIDLPEKVMEAQLIKRGPQPSVVTQGVKLSWELAQDSGADNSGLSFAERCGEMAPNEETGSFSAAIGVTVQERSAGDFNPYRVIKIKAEDASTGKVLADSAAVLSVSPGFGCAHCHADPGHGILALHDKANGTDLEAQAGSGQVFCKSCHMDLSVDEGKIEPGFVLAFSTAIHGWHAPFLKGREADACLTCHIGLGRPAAEPGKEAARPQAMFMRGIHLTRGLSCVNCHGHIEDHALALLRAEDEAGQSLATDSIRRITPRAAQSAAEVKPRLAWEQQPDCTSCHDFERKPVIQQVSGFNLWTPLPDADGAPELFSRRADYSGIMRCASCHGAPHAVYPARNPVSEGLDNIPPVQYQEAAAPLGANGNCAVCHGQAMDMPPLHHPIVEVSSTKISVPQGADLMMPPVRFPHERHTPLFDCALCHHTGYVDGHPLSCTSSGCHDAAEEDNAPEGQAYRYFRQAFHGGMPSCNACHEARLESGQATGPTDCAGCHKAPSSLWE